MKRPRLLDLFCCEGGAGKGYADAGFEVVGVDIAPQPRYPFEFHQADALEYLTDHWHEFDAIHASPTCQTRSRATAWRGKRENHPDLLTPTLDLLGTLTVPWVVENVPEAAWDGTMRPDYLLCGTQFGLRVKRHRVFQRGNWTGFELLPPCRCYRNKKLIPFEHKDERAFADAMGCTWMTNLGGRQAIPPAFTEHIGRQLVAAIAPSTEQTAAAECAFDPTDCAFCVAPAIRRTANGAAADCPLHGDPRPVPSPGVGS